MGLLFVVGGDEKAEGMTVDVSIELHKAIMLAIKNQRTSSYPLIRRINRFYSDVLYEPDEVEALIEELHSIYKATKLGIISKIIELCVDAKKQNTGIETIAD